MSLDLRKAFDTVNHQILLRKLELLGVRGICHSWFVSYLKNREQFVKIGKVESTKQSIQWGVPQGSILGPTLFLVYVNSISKLKLKSKIKLYADDTILVYSDVSVNTIKENIKNDLNIVEQWLCSHKLSLNIKKSSYMFIYSHKI